MTEVRFLSPDIILYLHDMAVLTHGGMPGLRDQGLLESAIFRVSNKLVYADLQAPDLFDLAAAYAFGLAKNHAFYDGNKRTGWAAAVAFLKLNRAPLIVPPDEAFAEMINLATNALSEDGFAAWLRSRA